LSKKNVELESTTLECIPTSSKLNSDDSKWKDHKYNQQGREKHAREKCLLNSGEKQPLNTNFYKVVGQINKYIIENNI